MHISCMEQCTHNGPQNYSRTANHPDMQKIRITGFFFEIGYIGSLNFGCYYLQYVPASKSFDHAWFEVLEAIALSRTWSDNR